MNDRGNLDKKEFMFLHDSLLKKFIEDSGGYEPPNVRNKYGFGILAQEDSLAFPSLKKAIETSPSVKEYLLEIPYKVEIETRYSLYQNYINLKKDNTLQSGKVKIPDVLLRAFLVYLGYDNFQKFKEALSQAHPPMLYRVLFYSIDHSVEEFSLSIDYASSPFWAESYGFHKDLRNPLFKGTAERKGAVLYINLECPERGGEEFHLIANVGNYSDLAQIDIMSASFMCVSTRAIPTAGECVILKKDLPTDRYDESSVSKLTAMLMIKRNRFTIKGTEIRNLDDLWANGNPVTDLDLISGRYAVIGYDLKGRWFRSKLEINPVTYECFYYTHIFKNNPTLSKLRGELTISNIISKKLCITTKSKENKGREIVSFVMIEFNGLTGENPDTDGVFITMSRQTGRSVAGHVVLIKASEDFEVGQISEQEKTELVSNYPRMGALADRFIQHTKL